MLILGVYVGTGIGTKIGVGLTHSATIFYNIY